MIAAGAERLRSARANLPRSVYSATVGARLIWEMGRFLRRPLDSESAHARLRQRLEHRATDFLSLMLHSVYSYPASPYLALLRAAGCESGDLVRLVERDGLADALRSLYRSGVYLTVDEMKGRTPARRGSTAITIRPSRLLNPLAASHLLTRTSGASGRSLRVPVCLANIQDRAVNTLLTLQARGGERWLKAVWGLPGGSAATVLRFSMFGSPAAAWFLQVHPSAPGLDQSYRYSGLLVRLGARLHGVRLPPPRWVRLDRPLPILRWLAQALAAGNVPHLWTFASPAVSLCRAALTAGIDLRGAQLNITGEPITAGRLAVIRQSGAEAVPDWGTAESGGFLSYGCLAPVKPDEVHVFHDLHALIQPGVHANPLPADALLVSSLRSTAPLVLLNVSTGDRGHLTHRACGCRLEQLGWLTHLSDIRSFAKVTAGGMTFDDSHVASILDDLLPTRFGGGPGDYQLVEEEGSDGLPMVRLLVHPNVGDLDDSALARDFLQMLGQGSGPERVMALQWGAGGYLRIERRPPLLNAKGKVVHLLQPSA